MGSDPVSQLEERRIVIAVADIAGFMKAARGKSNLDTFRMLDEFYYLVDQVVAKAGGRVVKFMGDAALMVFPEDSAPQAVAALGELKERAQTLWTGFDATCVVKTKAHVGLAACGPIGPEKRFDVIGQSVNELFLMPGSGPEVSDALRELLA